MPKPTVNTSSFDRFVLRAGSRETGEVKADITIEGKPVNYWRVLEFGSKTVWPEPAEKTTRGKDGRIFSKQAPQGFIFRHAARIAQFLREAYIKRVHNNRLPTHADLVEAANEAGRKALELIHAGAPTDSGELRDAIKLKEAR